MRSSLWTQLQRASAVGGRGGIIGALLLCAVVSAAAAWSLGTSATAVAPPGGRPAPLDVPLLSARRIPETVLRGAGSHRLDEQLDLVIGSSPPRSCLAVQPGGVGPLQTRGDIGGLVPASLVKLLVVHAAVETLGPDHRFTTRVMADGIDADGSVDDLHLIGGGDPFLGNDAWLRRGGRPLSLSSHTSIEELADRVVAAGVTRVRGSVIGDDSLFTSVVETTGDPEVGDDQERLGPVAALTVNEGYVDWPDDPAVPLSQGIPAADPAVHGARVLTDLLVERGVAVAGPAESGPRPPGASEIAAIKSSSVEELARTINTYSSNFGAQMLAKHLGLAIAGDGSVAGGAMAVTTFLDGRGLPMDDVTVVDGTGLSDQNQVTCRLIIDILIEAGPDSALADSLSIAGVRGTAGDRFGNAELRDLVRAKTGTLRTSRALAGFTRSWADGAETPFVFIMNETGLAYEEFDPWSRSVQEDLLITLVQFPCVPDRTVFEWPETIGEDASIDDGATRQGDAAIGSVAARATAQDDTGGDSARSTRAPPATDVDPLRIRAGDPLTSGCTDGQRIHDVRIDGYLVEIRYSPSCDALWARVTFSTVASGSAELHLVGYSCLEAETECRSLVVSAPILADQDCVNVPDEAGTCLLADSEQAWTEVLPTSVRNVRACLSLTPSFRNQDPAALDLDGCTPPAFERQPGTTDDRQLARTRTACRVPRTIAPPILSGSATDN